MMNRNVLLIMVDAFRADKAWGSDRTSRTPALDALRTSSTLFTHAFSTASFTTVCTSSLLTGSYPFVHGIRSLLDHRLRQDIPTLAETFQAGGYSTWAEVTGPLVPATGLNRGFESYNHRDSGLTLDTPWGDTLIDRVKNHSDPWFGFVHFWELHNPRRVLPEFDRPEFGHSLYDRAVSSLDSQLQRLFNALPEGTIVVLTGDHGEYQSSNGNGDWVSRMKNPIKWLKRHVPGFKKLKKHSTSVFSTIGRVSQKQNDIYYRWIGHGFHVYDYLVHVPLFLHGPGLFPEGLEINQLASHVDIHPTLASVLGLPIRDTSFLSGIDLMAAIRQPDHTLTSRALFLESTGSRTKPNPEQWLAGVRTERYKYVRGLMNEGIPEELYDLVADPQESLNLASRMPDTALQLRNQLRNMLDMAPAPSQDSDDYSPEEMIQLQEHLKSLGYLE